MSKKNFVVFEMNGDICALSVEEILEIVEVDTMVKTKKEELNVMEWRYKAIPVVDPIAMIGLQGMTQMITVRSKIIMVEKQGMKYGVLVENVVGIMEIDSNRVDEPSLSEARYVGGVFGEVKLFTPYVFLTKKMVEDFKKVYEIPIQHLDTGDKIHGKKSEGKERVVETILHSSLGLAIQATKSNADPTLIAEAIKIHNLASRLS